MVKYIFKRILWGILILFGVSIMIYLLIRLMPADYVDIKMQGALMEGTVTQEDVNRMKRLYGLQIEYPVDFAGNSLEGVISSWERFFATFKSYINGYWTWLSNMFKGDLGISFKYGQPVGKIIFENMGLSFMLSFIAMVFQFIIGIPLGILAATKPYGTTDYITRIFSLICMSLPSFFAGLLLLTVFSKTLGWFPYQGLISAEKQFNGFWDQLADKAWHLVLPIATTIIFSVGSLMHYTRTNMLEILNADYIRTARAKGCSEKSVIYKHAFRNTLVPIVTMMAGVLPSLFGGMMIIEQVFSIPGIGKKAFGAFMDSDIPFILGFDMFLAVLTVLGTLLSDLTYVLVNPRVVINK